MIRETLLAPAVVAGLRAAWEGAGGALLVPEAVDADLAAALRESLRPALESFWVADRGRYQWADAAPLQQLTRPVQRLAEALAGAKLHLLEARWLCFGPGDYSLFKDARGPAGQAIEATLDLSAGECPAASVVYLRASGELAFPHRPLSLAVVDRRGAHRYERYLPHSAGPAEVWRLRAAFVRD